MDGCAKNTDREIYRAPDTTGCGDFCSDSIFVTESGSIGFNVGGLVIVKPLREWHRLARRQFEAFYPDAKHPQNQKPSD